MTRTDPVETLNDPGTGTRGRSDRYGLFVRSGNATPVCIGPFWRSRCCHALDALRPLGLRRFVVIGFLRLLGRRIAGRTLGRGGDLWPRRVRTLLGYVCPPCRVAVIHQASWTARTVVLFEVQCPNASG